MPRMTKGNARKMLFSTIENFQKVTGERIACVFTWNGSLSVMGNEKFKSFISENKDNIWKLLYQPQSELIVSKPDHDHELINLLDKDILCQNVETLRRMVVFGIHQTIGKYHYMYIAYYYHCYLY